MNKQLVVIVCNAFGSPNAGVTVAACRAGGLGVLDLGTDPEIARRELDAVRRRWDGELGVRLEVVDLDDLRKRSGGRGGARLAAEIRLAPAREIDTIVSEDAPALLLALDGVTDPHNLGAILRSAAAWGVSAVIAPRDRTAPLNDAAVRASAGAVAHIPLLRVTNLARSLAGLSKLGVWTVGLAVDGDTELWDVDLTLPTVIVLGSEGGGLRPGVLRRCEVRARLSMPGPVSSLNVSVCAGTVVSEAARQRAQGGPGAPGRVG